MQLLLISGPRVSEFLSVVAALDVILNISGFDSSMPVVMALPNLGIKDFNGKWEHFKEFCAKNECALEIVIFDSHTDPNQTASLRFGDSRCDYIKVYIYAAGWFADRSLSDSLQAIDQFIGRLSKV